MQALTLSPYLQTFYNLFGNKLFDCRNRKLFLLYLPQCIHSPTFLCLRRKVATSRRSFFEPRSKNHPEENGVLVQTNCFPSFASKSTSEVHRYILAIPEHRPLLLFNPAPPPIYFQVHSLCSL